MGCLRAVRLGSELGPLPCQEWCRELAPRTGHCLFYAQGSCSFCSCSPSPGPENRAGFVRAVARSRAPLSRRLGRGAGAVVGAQARLCF